MRALSRPTKHHPRRPGRRRRRGDDSGVVMPMMAIMLVTLLGFAGFAVDVGHWYLTANQAQRAADAGALGGVVKLPGDLAGATATATLLGQGNGFDPGDVTVTQGSRPNQLRVTVQETVDNYFANLFGVGQTTITRTALAEYVRSIPMGSPDHSLGNDPERWGDAGYERPFFWLNIAGKQVNKSNGDRYTAGNCTGFSGCSGSTNLDYSENGYFFRLTVDAVGVQPLRVQAYDPAFFFTGDTCTNGRMLDAGSGSFAAQVATLQAQGHADAASRYVEGNTAWCTGDQQLNGADVETTYVVRAPDDTPFDNTDNPIVCGVTFDAYDEPAYPLLDQADGYRDGPIGSENMAFDDHFRQWADLCTIPTASVELGDYLIQVSTTADQSTPLTLGTHDPGVSTGGHNRYAMRAGFGDPALPGFPAGLSFSADSHLPIYVNQSTAATSTVFYLARIAPEHAGQILELQFYDVADGSDSDLTIVPPTDQTGDPVGPCTFIRDASPPEIVPTSGCTITGLNNAQYNGRVVYAQIPIPANYSCNDGDPLGCWFKVDLDFNGGSPRDTTTWTAQMAGDPVRLVE